MSFAAIPVISQKLRFDHLTLTNGLSNGRITSIAQDSIGFIWIGTKDGLNRYDGLKIKIYTHVPSDSTTIIGNTINDLFCDGSNFWVGTNKGIDFYNSTEEVFQHIPISYFAAKNITYSIGKIFKDFNNRIFIATDRGLFIYNGKDKVFKKFLLPDKKFSKINYSEITYISQDRDSIYWIGTHDLGVLTYDIRKNILKGIESVNGNINTLLYNKIFCIYEDNYHTIWIGSNEGLYKYSKSNGNLIRYLSDPDKINWLPHISVNKITEDSHNNLWIATNGGLSIFNRKDGSFINYFHDDFDDNSLSNNSVHCLFEDFQHNLWIGSGENGINIIKSQTIDFENFKRVPNKFNSLNYGYVLSVIEDRIGNIWIGTNGKGINKFDAKTHKFNYFIPPIATKSGKQAASVMTLLEDRDGKIWMGTYLGGIVVYDPKTNKYNSFSFNPGNNDGLSNNIINHIYQDSKGNIWIATNGGGVNIFKPGSSTFQHIRAGANSISDDFCSVICEDKSGHIWIGCFYGLNMYNPLTGKNVVFLNNNKKGSISSDVIFSLYQDSKERFWIGTEFGLNLFNFENNTFTTYTVDDGLPNNVINGILEDNRGYLWLSTNKGLARFEPEFVKSTNFNIDDGLASTIFCPDACFKNASGKLYFGGSEGLTFFNPDKTRHSKYKVPLVLTDFYIYNQSISPKQKSVLTSSIAKTSKITLEHDQSFIAIEFASLNFVNSNKDNYSYYLENFDRQWNNIRNQRVASYTNLPSGNYTFYVKATNESGIVAENSLNIVVKPPFWLTYYAYTVYFLLMIVLAYFIYSYMHSRNVYKHNLLVERMEKEKAIEINQAKIRFFVNVSHDFKTPLTLIISPLEKLITSGATLLNEERNNLYHIIYRNTLRLSRLINQIMDLRKIDTDNIRLSVTCNEIVTFINEIAISFQEYARNHSFDFTVESSFDSLFVWFDIDKIEKVIYNLLSNAFRYTPDGKSIKIRIAKADSSDILNIDSSLFPEGFIKISVVDQGRGIPEDLQEKIFTRFYQVHAETLANPSSSGIGLSITKEFIEMHQGYIFVLSKPKYGSTFSVLLPLGKNHFKNEELAKKDNIDSIPAITNETKEISTLEQSSVNVANHLGTKKKYKILIVEDNYELRSFLFDNLKSKYTIFEAANGKKGLEIVYSQFPDLVISDVMMPLMNGIELCKAIKTDIKISHIPIIILTVLNTIDNQIEGFEIGADDYVTKPFNLNLLEARIFNLIEMRKKIIKKFVEEIKTDLKNYSHNLLDEKFMQKAIEIVEKNISNFEFTAENFAEQIGMSRSNLHIKLKVLTNQSATEFIRIVRLKKAIELLSAYQYNISEVSYMVGFNSISYFNRCFKQQFGITPSEFLSNGLKEKDNTSK